MTLEVDNFSICLARRYYNREILSLFDVFSRDITVRDIEVQTRGFFINIFSFSTIITMSRGFFNYLIIREQEIQDRKIRRRIIRDSLNVFELPNNEFLHNYRISKEMALYLCNELTNSLQPINARDGLPVHYKVLASISLLGDGSYQRRTGQDHCFSIGQTTVSKYLSQFTEAVIRILLPQWIVFPATETRRQTIANEFRSKFGLPDVLGAIDCTHVAIFPPPHPQGIQFKNRKGYYSINTQLVVDVNCKILNINARYPGRVHDQFIFNNSSVKAELQRLYNGRIGNYYLLGDSGYALEPWLMTPVMDAQVGTAAERYTQWHCKVRNSVERTNGYLKGIFRCLGIDRTLHYDPEKACKIIKTCATLYNIMLHYRIPMEENVEVPELYAQADNHSGALLTIAQTKRNHIINTYFN